MKYIARVTLTNFQSHSHSEFIFGPNLNVIVGASDNGKSAVLRAVQWVLHSEPKGTAFVRIGTRECRVAVTMSDGAEIVREVQLTKGGSVTVNRYKVTVPGKEPQVFEGFGHDMPPEIAAAHGMPQVLLDSDKKINLHIGRQLAGPFLMGDTTGSFRAKAIGRLLGVHVVDAAVRNTQADLKRARAEVGRQDKEVQRLETELTPFANIPAQEQALAEGESILKQISLDQAKQLRMEGLKAAYESAEAERTILAETLAKLAGIEAAQASLNSAEAGRDKAITLRNLSIEYDQTLTDKAAVSNNLKTLEGIAEATGWVERAGQAAPRLKRLSALQTDWQANQTEKVDAEAKLARLKDVASLEGLPDRMQENVRRSDRLKRLAAEWTPVARDLPQLRAKVALLAKVAEASALIASTEQNAKRLAILQPIANNYADVVDKQATGMKLLADLEIDLQAKGEQYGALLRQMGKCPTCYTPVGPDVIHRAVAELVGHTH